jgi:hypothetical protein
MTRMTAEQKFLQKCNGNRRTRLFDPEDYLAYKKSLRRAKTALRSGKPYYDADHAGTVAKAYKYRAETSAWCVWVLGGEVQSSYGSWRCNDNRVGLPFTPESYLDAWESREWRSVDYTISHDCAAYIIACWRVSEGMPVGRAELHLVATRVPSEIMVDLPKKLQRALKGTSWGWPEGVSAKDCEAIVRERAEEIAELLPALAIISVSA